MAKGERHIPGPETHSREDILEMVKGWPIGELRRLAEDVFVLSHSKRKKQDDSVFRGLPKD